MARSVRTHLVHLSAFVLMGTAGAARAQQQWLDGGFKFVGGLACVTSNVETEVTTYTGYWGRLDGSFPQTGDISYVRAVAAVVGNPCSGGDVLGFDFFLPTGASLAVSAQTPVQCVATRLSDGFTTTTDPNIRVRADRDGSGHAVVLAGDGVRHGYRWRCSFAPRSDCAACERDELSQGGSCPV